MEKPDLNSTENSSSMPLENLVLTLEEFEIAEKNWANLDENIKVVLCYVSISNKFTFIPKRYIISYLEEFKELANISDKNFNLIFCDTFFGENNPNDSAFGEITYGIRPKYHNFVENKRRILNEYLDSLEM